MKKVVVYCFALLLMTFVSCQKEAINTEETEIAKEEITQKGGASSANEVGNELVILYPEGTTEAEKIIKRAQYNILEYKKCECADPNLELWVFSKQQSSGGGLEEKKATAKSDEEIEGAELNPNIKISETMFVDFAGIASTDDGLLKRVATNQGVTVAVLDTGIMYDYEGFTQPFLYNSDQNGCNNNGYTELFGWNFVRDNNNPYDDHQGRHGTIVSKLIASKFEQATINYQILPVKVADETGNIRYFDALCGFQFAANKPDVNIINMSFGWDHHNRELLEKFIDEAVDILVVTSAGNKGFNNDTTPHFPSSYESENILAIAALRNGNSGYNNPNASVWDVANSPNSNSGLAAFSNRGTISVDIAAPGENIPFTYNNEILYVNGTSYSAALTSGYSGTLYTNGMSGIALKMTVIENSIYDINLSEIQYSKHIPD
ncbi:S8 family serine peptidase [Kordia sp. YSTF-M3]|uniref:S8 family serine peptidase n=1 Tax=Kordia aestuariivivens TaxID=2759037 RepID=A0ABR7QGY9_9FLAO|nr:S8 family serine peptidase [Kordia aestuariivivens]MBC8757594.1 S8 family serine peptidase [Kordia aestuariivivens]